MFETALPKALESTFTGSIIVQVDGRSVYNSRDLLRTVLQQIATRLNIELSLAEDIEEFHDKTDHLDLPVIFIMVSDSASVPYSVFLAVLDIFKVRMSSKNVNFVMDNEKPTIDLPIYQQDRLLHFSVNLPSPTVLVDELVHRLLRYNAWLLKEAPVCRFMRDELYERAATFNQITRMLSYVSIYRENDCIDHYGFLKLYLTHFAGCRLLKQERSLLETLVSVQEGELGKSVEDLWQRSDMTERLAVLVDVKRAVCIMEKLGLIDDLIEQVRNGNDQRILQLTSHPLTINPSPFAADSLKKAFHPDTHLALQTALRHSHLYTTHHISLPTLSLHQQVSESCLLTQPISRLHHRFGEKELFYTCLRELQLCGQVGAGRRRDCVERLNPDEQAILPDQIAGAVYE